MKYIIIFLSLLCSQFLLSQNSNNYDEFKSISNEINLLKKSQVKDIVVISDQKKGTIIWRCKKIKAIEVYRYDSKRKKIRLSKRQKKLFKECLQNYNDIAKIKNINCDKKVNTFYTLNVKFIIEGEQKATNSFYSHCGEEEQRKSLNPLLELHYSLR